MHTPLSFSAASGEDSINTYRQAIPLPELFLVPQASGLIVQDTLFSLATRSFVNNTSMSTTPESAFMSPTIDLASLYALLKIGLVLTAGIAVHLSLSPPNPPAPPKHVIDRRTLFERCVRWVTFCSKTMVWAETLLDALATTVVAFPTLPLASSLSSLLCPSRSAHLLLPSPVLIAGVLATLCGALIRLACFRALGSLFTFELSITPAHTLITHGPYSFVRHPSYTGVYLTLLGASMVGLAPGAWFRECGLQLGTCGDSATRLGAWGSRLAALAGPASAGGDAALLGSRTNSSTAMTLDALQHTCTQTSGVGRLFAWLALGFWALKVCYALRSTNRRLVREDMEMRRVFGQTWDIYAERVPWRLLPGVS